MYRQGDLLIVPGEFTADRYTRPIEDGVVQHGEATGHAHRIEGGQAYNVRGETFVVSDGFALLTHDEHDTIHLPEGTFRILRQREFTPEGERRVRD